jgi:hypothetical protein
MSIMTDISNFPGFKFLETHEKLIITVLVCIALLWGVHMGLNAWEKHDAKNVTALQAQVTALQTQVAQTDQQRVAEQQQAAQALTAANTVVAAVTTQNKLLTQQQAARDKQTQNQQQIDLHATIPQLSQRFAALVPGTDPADIKIAPDNQTVTVGSDTAEKTVAQLELIPELQGDLKDETQKNTGLQSEFNVEQTYALTLEHEITTGDKEIALDDKLLASSDQLCQAKVNLEKTKTKKAFLKGLGIGGAIGYIGGLITAIGLHL